MDGNDAFGSHAALTPIQSRVLELDRAGLKPKQIGAELDLSITRVSNVKARLRKLGYAVTGYVKSSGWTALAPHMTKRHVSREFCACGLSLPCNDCLVGTQSFRQPAMDSETQYSNRAARTYSVHVDAATSGVNGYMRG